MSFLHMGFPPKKDAIDRKSVSNETTEMRDGGGMEFGAVGEESATDFWPIQHPIEPPQGDKPVECPLPHSSVMNEWRFSRSFHRKVAEPTSKRRHSVSHDGDHYRSLLFPDKSHYHKSFNSSTSLRFNKLNQFSQY